MLHCLTNSGRAGVKALPLTFVPNPPSGYAPASDTSIYDALGQRIAVQQTQERGQVHLLRRARCAGRMPGRHASGDRAHDETNGSGGRTHGRRHDDVLDAESAEEDA